jgi:hypothetical protein
MLNILSAKYKGAADIPLPSRMQHGVKNKGWHPAPPAERYACVSRDNTVGTDDTGINPTSVTTAVI